MHCTRPKYPDEDIKHFERRSEKFRIFQRFQIDYKSFKFVFILVNFTGLKRGDKSLKKS